MPLPPPASTAVLLAEIADEDVTLESFAEAYSLGVISNKTHPGSVDWIPVHQAIRARWGLGAVGRVSRQAWASLLAGLAE